MKFDRIRLNRWILQRNGTLYPWKFVSTSTGGQFAVLSSNIFHLVAFQIQLAFCTLYSLYILWVLVEHTIIHGIDSSSYHIFGLHLGRSMFAVNFTYREYEFFVSHADGHKLLYNFVQLSPDLSRRGSHPIKGGFLQEQLLALAPVMLYSFCPMLPGLFLLDSDDKQFAFSLLPTKLQNSWVIVMMLVATGVEFRFSQFLAAAAHFGGFHCVTFVRTIQAALTHATKELEKKRESGVIDEVVRDGYSLARKVHLAMAIFNLSTAGVIFADKIICLFGGTVGLYFLSRLIMLQPVVSMFFFALAFNGIVFYTVKWDNASLIPAEMKELKDQVSIVTTAGGAVQYRPHYCRRVLRSIPCTGLSAGGFRSMERDSTLIFMDFVVRNVLSLLMTFK